jgi:hypothetical protein
VPGFLHLWPFGKFLFKSLLLLEQLLVFRDKHIHAFVVLQLFARFAVHRLQLLIRVIVALYCVLLNSHCLFRSFFRRLRLCFQMFSFPPSTLVFFIISKLRLVRNSSFLFTLRALIRSRNRLRRFVRHIDHPISFSLTSAFLLYGRK